MTDAQVHTHEADELTDAQLDAVTGGDKAEAQIFQMLTETVNAVLKNFGSTMQRVARAG